MKKQQMVGCTVFRIYFFNSIIEIYIVNSLSIYINVFFRTFQEERDCPQFGTCDGEFKNIHHTIRAGIV